MHYTFPLFQMRTIRFIYCLIAGSTVMQVIPPYIQAADRLQGYIEGTIIDQITVVTEVVKGGETKTAFPYVVVKDVIQGQPDCGRTNNRKFVIDLSTHLGRAAMATLISAAAEGKKVSLWGNGKCNLMEKSETLSAVTVMY